MVENATLLITTCIFIERLPAGAVASFICKLALMYHLNEQF